MTRVAAVRRAVLTVAVVLCVVATVLSVASSPYATSPELELAADTSLFDPGNIISDSMFFDPNALSYQQVESFLAAKGAGCRAASDGTPCLKDFTQSTFTRYGDAICPITYYGAPNETAASIIWRVGQVCKISPKVLLVLLQKEQGLITASGSSLTPRKYQIAAGMGCPDTAACDTQYYGFYNQVYSAARQYQRYATYPKNYSYRAGQNNTIYWSPNTACGTSVVYIKNQATAGLYNYTPYRPNAAALRAGYGTGDGCSAYGNRNFWLYFTDWFGSTQSPGGDAIMAYYAAKGGSSGALGSPVTGIICGMAAGGCGQVFQNATVYWSAATAVYSVAEPVLSAWGMAREGGPLGYPASELICGMVNGGCGQVFQGGRIYYTAATGAHILSGSIQDAWIGQGWEAGPLGYPTTDVICGLTNGGCGQLFQGGRIYTSAASGTRITAGPVQDAWVATGAEAGPLGYPTSNVICGMANSGCGQVFQGGRIYSTPSTGAHPISGSIQSAWIAQGWENGPLGYPSGDQVCALANGGCKQQFQGGTLYSLPAAGSNPVSAAYAAAYTATGGESGVLGYPVTGLICGMANSGCGQVFQGGRIYSTPSTGAHAISGSIQSAWIAQGWENGPLGYPTADEVCGLPSSGCKQDFQGGTLYARPGAVYPVSTAYSAAYTAAGGVTGPLGYPTSGLICGLRSGGCGQLFQGGRIYSTAATGAHAVSGALQAEWFRLGIENGSLGYPTGDQVCGLPAGGCKQDFQGGRIFSSAAGTFTLSTALAAAHTAAGGESGALGYPTSGLICGLRSGGCGQLFQGGRIYTSPATGAHSVAGPIQNSWIAAGAEGGSLGYPTSEPYAVTGGTAQDFQGGRLTLDTTTGTVTRS